MLLVDLLMVLAATQIPSPTSRVPSACEQATAEFATDAGTTELCAGEHALRTAVAARPDDARRSWMQAEQHFRRAGQVSRQTSVRALALAKLVDCYDDAHLNQPKDMERALRELLALDPSVFTHLARLVRLLEGQGLWEAAETALQDARRGQPEAVEPYRQLAQFYARRVSAMAGATPPDPANASGPGEPDEHGVYRIGGSLVPPARIGVPQYPPDAAAARVSGVVLAEIVIDGAGHVADARVVRGIPMLDDAALEAVRHWQFAPSIVNGAPVPVRMTVTVNFTLPPSPGSPRQAPATPTPQR